MYKNVIRSIAPIALFLPLIVVSSILFVWKKESFHNVKKIWWVCPSECTRNEVASGACRPEDESAHALNRGVHLTEAAD